MRVGACVCGRYRCNRRSAQGLCVCGSHQYAADVTYATEVTCADSLITFSHVRRRDCSHKRTRLACAHTERPTYKQAREHTHTHINTLSLSLSLKHTHTHTHTLFSLTYGPCLLIRWALNQHGCHHTGVIRARRRISRAGSSAKGLARSIVKCEHASKHVYVLVFSLCLKAIALQAARRDRE